MTDMKGLTVEQCKDGSWRIIRVLAKNIPPAPKPGGASTAATRNTPNGSTKPAASTTHLHKGEDSNDRGQEARARLRR